MVIGVDPHKRSVTLEARDARELLWATGSFPTSTAGYRAMLRYCRQWPTRVWAVEGAGGVHPEVSFAILAGRPLPESKRTWAGAIRRRRLLTEAGIVLDDDLGPAGTAAAVDDFLDDAAAWTARRVARNEADLTQIHLHRPGGGLRWTGSLAPNDQRHMSASVARPAFRYL
jgi:hypothetical protein